MFKNLLLIGKNGSETSGKLSGSGKFPLLLLNEIVVFPGTSFPYFAVSKGDIAAVDTALKAERLLFALCSAEYPSQSGKQHGSPTRTGTVCRIMQQIHMPDGAFRIVVEGQYRASITSGKVESGSVIMAEAVQSKNLSRESSGSFLAPEIEAFVRNVRASFARYAELSKKVSAEIQARAERAVSPDSLCDIVGGAVPFKLEEKLNLLCAIDVKMRLELLLQMLDMENEVLGIEKKISGDIKTRIDKKNHDHLLREQLKEINKELGEPSTKEFDDFAELKKSLEAKKLPPEVSAKTFKELERLSKMPPFSPDAGILRAYLEWISDLPWNETSEDQCDLSAAEKILNQDHYGLARPKERIIEFIATHALNSGEALHKGPILCFVGAPGTGKTSLGASVARALGRRFVRFSLGGIRDEAEIRGHRKTYVGALPGKILQCMKKAGTINPVFLLDELDKISLAGGSRGGDPASALLEVLDPEQNINFTDNYLEVPYNLSQVLFIATANSLHSIPYPLLDRMEIIEISGYSDSEKLCIAKQFLVPKALSENGLAHAKIRFSDGCLRSIISTRTMESGVRSLERELNRAARRLAKDAVTKGFSGSPLPLFLETLGIKNYKANVSSQNLAKLLGRPKYSSDFLYKDAQIGIANGLAWTESGGVMLAVESLTFPGKGELAITGNLGDVMKESASIALSYLRSVQHKYRFLNEDLNSINYHVHIPEGAIPKDGPSAGITLAVSLFSTLSGLPARARAAMTGELTLTGRVLPIGGLKEKVLAAIRGGMKLVVLPEANRPEWKELCAESDSGAELRTSLDVCFVEDAEAVFKTLFDIYPAC